MPITNEHIAYLTNLENAPDHSLGILAYYFASLRYPEKVSINAGEKYQFFLESFGTRNGLVHETERGKYEVRIPIGETDYAKTGSDSLDEMGLTHVANLLKQFGKPGDTERFLRHLHQTLRRTDKAGKNQLLINQNRKVSMTLSPGLKLAMEYNPSTLNDLRCWLVFSRDLAERLVQVAPKFDPKPSVAQ